MKRRITFIAVAMLLFTPFSHAATTEGGVCFAIGGTYIFNLNLNGAEIPADKNQAGTEVRDLTTLQSPSQYKLGCNCLSHFTTSFRSVYFTARSPLSVDTVKNGYTYYRLNDQLSIASSIHVLGRDYLPVPFEAEPNRVTSGIYCYASGEEGSEATLDTGSQVKLSFLIDKPFIGKVTVPGTTIATLYGGIDEASSLASTEKLAEIKIAGDIVVPQNCEIAPGQSLEIDFGKIPASAFSTTKGEAVGSRKIRKMIQVKCTGMLDENIVRSAFHADPVDADGTMMKVNGNDDVGIVIYDKWDRVVNVNGGSMEMDMGANQGGAEVNSLTFSAAPASATGSIPKPGAFEAWATLTLEIQN